MIRYDKDYLGTWRQDRPGRGRTNLAGAASSKYSIPIVNDKRDKRVAVEQSRNLVARPKKAGKVEAGFRLYRAAQHSKSVVERRARSSRVRGQSKNSPYAI
jgi:hypothetical protein